MPEVAGGARQLRSSDTDLREHEQGVRVTDGGLRRASQTFAAQRLALGLVKTSRSGGRQRSPRCANEATQESAWNRSRAKLIA